MTFLNKFFRFSCFNGKTFYLHTVTQLITNKGARLCSTDISVLTKKNLRSLRKKKSQRLDSLSWFLLVIPVSAFGLGTWQIQRKIWKDGLIKDLERKALLPPIDFPQNLDELNDMEYRAVRVKGKFDHSNEILMGPRPLISDFRKTNAYSSSLLSSNGAGYLVVTPFTLSDRNLTILVNRGWVPAEKKNPRLREEGQVTEEVELVGLVRHSEKRQPLGMKNYPQRGLWMYRDLEKMSEVTGAAPIFIDASSSSSVPGGPRGGQTIVGLKNDHFTYIITWYLLSITTGCMWWSKFLKGH